MFIKNNRKKRRTNSKKLKRRTKKMETKVKITDLGDAWIYQHMPYLMAFSELIQKWIISVFPIAGKFFDYMSDRPGLDAIIPTEERKKIENKEIEKIKEFFVILNKNIETAKAIIINTDGYIAINNAAEQAYDSVAPPTAPPENASPAPFFGIDIQKIYDPDRRKFYINQLANIFDILYISNYSSDIDDRINDDILSGDIRRKIVSNLINHAVKNPRFYPAIFGTWTPQTEKRTQNFVNFKIREFWLDITTRDTHDENRTEPTMLRARQAYYAINGGVKSLDAEILTTDGETTLYDYIADLNTISITPENYLLLSEYISEHTDDIDVDDAGQQQALFALTDDEPDDEPLVIDIKPPRPRTGRAARLKSQQTFDFGGDDNAN